MDQDGPGPGGTRLVYSLCIAHGSGDNFLVLGRPFLHCALGVGNRRAGCWHQEEGPDRAKVTCPAECRGLSPAASQNLPPLDSTPLPRPITKIRCRGGSEGRQ